MARIHIPPIFEGRRLSSLQRAALLMEPGEIWVKLGDIPEACRRGRGRPVEVIWHGDYGSIRRPIDAHLETCAPPSKAVQRLRDSAKNLTPATDPL